MKTLSSVRSSVAAAVAVLGLSAIIPNAPAAPGGGGAAVGGGTAIGGGGHAAAVGAAGGGRGGGGFAGGMRGGGIGSPTMGGVGLSPGQHISTPGAGGIRSVSPSFAGGGRFNNVGPANTGVNTGLVRPNFNNLSHPTFGNGRVGNIGNTGIVANRNGVPTMTRRFDGPNAAASANVINQQRARLAAHAVRPSNAWTDNRANGLTPPAGNPNRSGFDRAYDPGQSYLQNGQTPGQHLYPGASGYRPGDDYGRRAWQGPSRDRGSYRHRPYYNPYYYAGIAYPYLFSSYFPGYYGYGYGSSFGYYPSYDTGYVGTSITSSTLSDGYVNNPATGNYYDQQGVAQDQSASIDQSLPHDQPSQVGPDVPQDANQAPSTESGPDSLVEAVQDELARRGYFPGKANGMYGNGTREALRHFQTDRKLAVTGRINEATLHALQLD